MITIDGVVFNHKYLACHFSLFTESVISCEAIQLLKSSFFIQFFSTIVSIIFFIDSFLISVVEVSLKISLI